jgi:hypothetical protein
VVLVRVLRARHVQDPSIAHRKYPTLTPIYFLLGPLFEWDDKDWGINLNFDVVIPEVGLKVRVELIHGRFKTLEGLLSV